MIKKIPSLALAFLGLLAVAFVTGCVTHIKVSETTNPAPAEAFNGFTRFELNSITMDAPYSGQEANERARAKIQENLTLNMGAVISQWNTAGADKPARTLVIKPRITEIKFISGGSRFWAGAMAGSSAVILHAQIVEKETGKVIASPIFYSKASAMGGAFSIGATDNVMLVRVAGRLSDYLKANYPAAVGGITGLDAK